MRIVTVSRLRSTAGLVCGALAASACASLVGLETLRPEAAGDAGPEASSQDAPAVPSDADGDGGTGSDAAGVDGGPHDPACDAIVSYWPGEGTADDLTGRNKLDWRPTVAAKSYAPGKFGEAFDFVLNANAYLENQSFTGLATADTLTISLWWKGDASYRTFFLLKAGAQETLKLDADNADLGVSITGETRVTSAAMSPNAATFSHLAVTLRKAASGSSVRFYLNGQPLGGPANLATPVSPGVFAASSLLQVGGPSSSAVAFDEVLLFDRALDDAEVAKVYASGLSCGPALERPDAGAVRCPAPAAPEIRCGTSGTPCNSSQECCTIVSVDSCQARTGSCSGGSVTMECVMTPGACSATGKVCCLAGFTESDVGFVCTKTNRVAKTSACKTSCAATELQLCGSAADCVSPRTCTGFSALTPGTATDYPLGACVP